jgi:superfamily II DNA or RNA helicase
MTQENKTDLVLYKKDSSSLVVECNHIITKELSSYFSAKAANYKFHPLYKQGIWKGDLYFFQYKTNELPWGLLEELKVFARKGSYTISYKFEPRECITRESFYAFIETLGLADLDVPIEPREYQIEAAYQAITKRTINIKSVTSSGKSLILYFIIRYMDFIKEKVLLVVPTVNLVTQMYSDFEEYGWENVADKCHMIYGGQKKLFDCPVSISTWQSLSGKVNDEIFKLFKVLIIDEAHQAKAKSLSGIAKLCIEAEWRIGCSGTYPEYFTADWFSIVGSLGPIVNFSSYKDLQDKGHISNLRIYTVRLKYPMEYRKEIYVKSLKNYQEETDLVNGNEKRHRFLLKMVQNLKQNALVLFTKKEKHGYPLKELFEAELKDKKIYYIDGDIDAKEREAIRYLMEKDSNVVLLATYGTLSTGVNIPNIHHVIFASGYKSKVKVLQSIGRGLRKHKSKTHMTLYDIVDDLSFQDKSNDIKYINFSLRHSKERVKIYEEEGFNYKEIKFDIT